MELTTKELFRIVLTGLAVFVSGTVLATTINWLSFWIAITLPPSEAARTLIAISLVSVIILVASLWGFKSFLKRHTGIWFYVRLLVAYAASMSLLLSSTYSLLPTLSRV